MVSIRYILPNVSKLLIASSTGSFACVVVVGDLFFSCSSENSVAVGVLGLSGDLCTAFCEAAITSRDDLCCCGAAADVVDSSSSLLPFVAVRIHEGNVTNEEPPELFFAVVVVAAEVDFFGAGGGNLLMPGVLIILFY